MTIGAATSVRMWVGANKVTWHPGGETPLWLRHLSPWRERASIDR